MSTVQLIVKFTGLCGFVLNSAHSVARVVLPDAMATNPPHQPAVLVPHAHWDLAANRRQYSVDYIDFISNESRYIIPLLKEDLLLPAGVFPTTTLVPTLPLTVPVNPTNPGCPAGASPRALGWISNMADVVPPGDMRDNVLIDASPADVVARIKLTAGTLSTAAAEFRAIGPVGARQVVKWQFKDSTGGNVGTPRALSEVIDLALTVDTNAAGFVEVGSKQFNGFSGDPLLFVPQMIGGVMGVVFWIVNIPLPDLLTTSPNPFQQNDHFMHFYSLRTTMVGPTPVPLNTNLCPPAGNLGMSNPKCPSTLFADNNNA